MRLHELAGTLGGPRMERLGDRLMLGVGALEVLGALAIGATLLGWVPAWLGFAAAVGFVVLIIGAITTRARAKSPFGMVLADVVTLIMAILTLGAMRALAMG